MSLIPLLVSPVSRCHLLQSLCLAVFLAFCFGATSSADSAKTAKKRSSMFSDFPIVFYSVDGLSDRKMEDARKIGATVIHTYRMGHSADPKELAWERRFMKMAAKHGLKVMINLNGGKWIDDPKGLETLRAIARNFKDDPALAFWYLYDEPDGRHTPKQVRPLYELLKKETPDVPVAICSAWTKRWWAYTPDLDITMVDIYPVYDEPFPKSSLQHVTTFVGNAIARKKPVIPVLQLINWKCFAKPGEKEYRKHEVAKLRFPEAREIRYWIYGCLAQGDIVGLSFWSFYHSVKIDPKWIHETLPPLLREVKAFASVVAPIDKPRVFMRGRDSNLYVAAWERDSGLWLVLVNAWPLERDVRCWLEDEWMEGKLVPWGQTRKVPAELTKGAVTVHAQPWEVFIWKVEGAKKGTKATETGGK